MRVKIEPDRARAIGRALFQKYDLGKRGMLGPKQCYEVFSDFCYRILYQQIKQTINPQPTMQEANSMFEVLDDNKDKVVTQSDFESLAVKYLCQSGSFSTSNVSSNVGATYSSSQVNQQSSSSYSYSSTKKIDLQGSTTPISNQGSSKKLERKLTLIARKRIDVARRLFRMFDKDNNGYLTDNQIPLIIQETYKEMGQNYQPNREDIKTYMKMVDSDGDGRVSLAEFEEIILRSLKNAGFEIYQ